MPEFYRDHILLVEHTESMPYTSVNQGRNPVFPRTNIDRVEQGTAVREAFQTAVADFLDTAPDDEFIYVVFTSAAGFLLDLDKMNTRNHRVANYRKINEDPEDETYEATVYLNKKAIGQFLGKIEQYINENTWAGNPKNQTLIANIDKIRAATLRSFWMEPELPFPGTREDIWWEVWLSRDLSRTAEEQLKAIYTIFELSGGFQIGAGRSIIFPENIVFLVKGTGLNLAVTLLYTDELAELRKPRNTADFFTYLDKPEQAAWITDLLDRLVIDNAQNQVSICLLDTGVNISHPLLAPLIPEGHIDAINPAWGNADSNRLGHGTPMAGLLLYGDLTDVLGEFHEVRIYHHFESVKILEGAQQNDPELFGAITQEAVARAEIINPNFKRVICMAVTSDLLVHRGQPSSWSAAIDQLCFGEVDEPNTQTLFLVSAGNVPLISRIDYPVSNQNATIEDPAQAFNALTIGAYTIKDKIDLDAFPGATLLAEHGDLSPSSTTSLTWFTEWPRKPDLVMEGGNHAMHRGGLIDPDSLQLLSTGKGGLMRPLFTTFGDTSGATALAAKFAAELYTIYPDYWPETIRALMVHSADWTRAMTGGHPVEHLPPMHRQVLVAKVGYGVPNFQRARFSANNSLSLVIQRTLRPYKFEESRVKTNEFHLVDLPWPSDILAEMQNAPVKLTVTLSYFIEPNPGARQYGLAASYRSHGLRFKMKDTYESDEGFAARVSKAARDEDEEFIKEGAEHWILGNQVRDKGSLHKDIWLGTAVELSTRNKIAVFSVGGWWKTRKLLKRYDNDVRYSLIVTIDTPDNGIDIYTPVQIQVPVIL
ncbi:S8 family peptidase [Mucilaginibacter sp. SJ]|uniref:S8 family peptidase n=1 Tax=Mucilaginibacter sp. SJ TaxID=3029053 RepID=UPI0023A9A9BF|nr:S8 family peptidase [Mucilaginibacter sp. SJ]WEA00739.1 S8 family peptidase [Mucilaginibacter sp. SJ]